MMIGVRNNDLGLVYYHICKGVDINYQHPEYLTSPLVESIRYGHFDMAKLLLDNGASQEIKEVFSNLYPIHIAKTLGNNKIMTLLKSKSLVPQKKQQIMAIPNRVKSVVCTGYGSVDVLKLIEIWKPMPKKRELLVRNYATSVNSADWKIRKAKPWIIKLFFGLTKPRKSKQILGTVFAGVIESVGEEVTSFKIGDRVFGMTGIDMGTYSEYVIVKENYPIAIIPSNINFVEAAALPFGAITALNFLQKARVQKGQTILIYGASGAVGTAAIQIAKHLGATVTAVCSASNKNIVLKIGADNHIDYSKKAFSNLTMKYDIVFETVNKLSYKKCRHYLKPRGVLILGSSGLLDIFQGVWTSIVGKQKVISGLSIEKPQAMKYIQNLLIQGSLVPTIDRIYKLESISDAHEYVELGHKKGNVVIEIP